MTFSDKEQQAANELLGKFAVNNQERQCWLIFGVNTEFLYCFNGTKPLKKPGKATWGTVPHYFFSLKPDVWSISDVVPDGYEVR